MSQRSHFDPKGVIPACLLPFKDDLSIDERSLRKHLRDVAAVSGLSAQEPRTLVVSPRSSCIVEITTDEVGDRIAVVNGIYADGSLEAGRLARMAAQAGASCLLVFPPNGLALGATERPEMVIAHFKRIADATDLPLIAFQYRLESGLGYPLDTLLKLVDQVPTVRAIKDWCNNVPLHVLTTHSAWLLSSLVLGCNGLLSGAGSVIADLQAALFQAVQAGDLARAREINDRIYPLAEAFYANPFVDMHNRMKEALLILGRLPCAAVRPPLVKLGEAEIACIRAALEQSRLLPKRGLTAAAAAVAAAAAATGIEIPAIN